ncbi:MAG: hypothetical protein RLZ98_2104 [Pseudomonadota bacterium]
MTEMRLSYVDQIEHKEHKRLNQLHSLLLLGGIGLVVALSAILMFGWIGLMWAVLMVAMILAFAPRIPPESVMRCYRAERIDARRNPQLASIVETLAQRAELPVTPALYVIPSSMLNAFATGTPNTAVIAITEGMLRKLTMRELVGVLAHEMSHVRNNDLWIMSLADVMTRVTQSLSYLALFLVILNLFSMASGEPSISWLAILLLYFAPAISSLLQMGLSRAREYDADLEAALLTGDPMGLASALNRVERYAGAFWEDFMYPVPGRRVPQPSVLRTHPETRDRIERLKRLDIRSQYPPIEVVDEPMVSMVGVGPIGMRPRHRWPGIWY